ncbi:hypothetical protein LX36DRAFT_30094 [Colletotrichum falcatum]|nr:hypothetical protein LX36DRAFT_30094 [Colletotrichum falcatum]
MTSDPALYGTGFIFSRLGLKIRTAAFHSRSLDRMLRRPRTDPASQVLSAWSLRQARAASLVPCWTTGRAPLEEPLRLANAGP